MARGCWRERGRDLINQVNPFLRSFVDSVEIQFEKRAQTASTEKYVFTKHSRYYCSIAAFFYFFSHFLCFYCAVSFVSLYFCCVARVL